MIRFTRGFLHKYEFLKPFHWFVTDVLARPYEPTDLMPQKIQVWRFLARINEGEKLGEININPFIITHLLSV